MLSVEEQREIEAEASKFLHKRAAGSEALKIVQRHRGWISDECLRDIAEFLDMTVAELDSIATFYNLIYRREVGRHVILLCDSVCCWITDYEKIRDHLIERLGIQLGETTSDGRFTLLPICCIGACDMAPAMMIDEDLHGNLDPEKIDSILEQYQ